MLPLVLIAVFTRRNTVRLDQFRRFELIEKLQDKLPSSYLEFEPFHYNFLSFLLVMEADDCDSHFLACTGIHKNVDILNSGILIEDVSQFPHRSILWYILNQNAVVDSKA